MRYVILIVLTFVLVSVWRLGYETGYGYGVDRCEETR